MSTGWFTLTSGRSFFPFSPSPDDVFIGDIAKALSNICRFNGHCKERYSVAQHSVHCSERVASGFELEALLHDATEAYVGDMVRPIKVNMPEYTIMENNVHEKAVAPRFGLPPTLSPPVHKVDNRMLVTEARDLIPPAANVQEKWGLTEKAFDDLDICRNGVHTWSSKEAEFTFLRRFYELYTGDPYPHYEDQILSALSWGSYSLEELSVMLRLQGIPKEDTKSVVGTLLAKKLLVETDVLSRIYV